MKNGAWDPQRFFATGVAEIQVALQYVESKHPLRARRRALDFGCGVGRLSQALAEHFDEVKGVDISPSMLEHARGYNRFGDRCQYVLNERSDLSVFPDQSFDLIYSMITLQHMPPRYSLRYIREFVRVLAPEGVLLFQLPGTMRREGSTALGRFVSVFYSRFLWDVLHPRTPLIKMYGVKRERVLEVIGGAGGEALDVQPDEAAGPQWEGFRYLVARRPIEP